MTTTRIDDFVNRFEAMATEMQEHPQIAVTHFKIFEPTSEETISRAEEKLGFELNASIKSFYRQADGLQFRWKDRDSDHYQEGSDDTTKTEFTPHLCGDNDEAEGVIDIWPLSQVFIDDYYIQDLTFEWMADSTEEFRGEEYNLKEFFEAVQPFDRFSFYNSVAFWVGDKKPGSTVVMGDDHDATFTNSRVTDFESYLEFILAYRGSVAARRKNFIAFKGHTMDPLTFEKSDFSSSPLPVEEIVA